jgi:hypothetical protein
MEWYFVDYFVVAIDFSQFAHGSLFRPNVDAFPDFITTMNTHLLAAVAFASLEHPNVFNGQS